MLITVIVLQNGRIQQERVGRAALEDSDTYEHIRIAEDTALLCRRRGMEWGFTHNAMASLLAKKQVYGSALLVGLDNQHHRYDDVPQRYIETYEINRQEKQGGKHDEH